jgi:homopolymeric O-antigen transport system permease protein
MPELPVTIYSPESSLRHPVQLLKAMFRDLAASRELAWRLFVRDTSAQYRQSIFGYVWAFIPPLMASLPFIFLNSQGVVSVKGTGLPYAAYAMVGTTIWQVFVDALNNPLKTVITSKAMLARINFPREAIILSGIAQTVFGFLIRLVLLAGVFIWFHIVPPVTALLFPAGILALILTGTMLGVLLVPIGLLYKDVQMTIPVVTMCLMYLTPGVLYPPHGVAAALAKWNPLAPLVEATRAWLTTGVNGPLDAFFAVSGVTLVLLFFGWMLYRLALPHVIARIGN